MTAPSTPGNADVLRDAIEVLVRQHFGPGSITSGGAVSTPAGYEFATAVVGLLASLSPPEQVGGEAEWLREGTTVYQLHQKGWRLGKPVMVNRVTVQVTVDPTSDLDALTVAEQVRAALSPPPMSPADSGGGWREQIEATIKRRKLSAEGHSRGDHPTRTREFYRGQASGFAEALYIIDDAAPTLKEAKP